jgi:hypothetical protein
MSGLWVEETGKQILSLGERPLMENEWPQRNFRKTMTGCDISDDVRREARKSSILIGPKSQRQTKTSEKGREIGCRAIIDMTPQF